MRLIETTAFTKHVYDYLSEEEYSDLQNFLARHPESGRIVAGSGGVRKIRWAASGRGKRGGARIIYYFKKRDGEIWFLTIYAKSDVETISSKILRQIKEEIENG